MTRPLPNLLADLTAAEEHVLLTHLRYAGDESFDAGEYDSMQEADNLHSYVTSVRRNVMGAEPRPPKITRHDATEYEHESVFGALDAAERSALAVHLSAAQGEARDAGWSGRALGELVVDAHAAEHAATAKLTEAGLMHGRTLPRR